MSIYKKVGIRHSVWGQVAAGLVMLAILVIVVWSFIRNGAATWKMVPFAVLVLAIVAWQFRGYRRKDG